jgi:hypothetical protein
MVYLIRTPLRYDLGSEGAIEYMHFINSAMFYPAVEPDFGHQGR